MSPYLREYLYIQLQKENFRCLFATILAMNAITATAALVATNSLWFALLFGGLSFFLTRSAIHSFRAGRAIDNLPPQ